MKHLVLALMSMCLSCLTFSQRLDVVPFTGSETSGYVSSYILTSGRESILIDAPMSTKDTRRLVDTITRLNRHLKAVLITHSHPDHYLGASEIRKAFPSIKIMATHDVAIEMATTAPAQYQYYKTILGDDMPGAVVLPDSTVGELITLGNVNIQVRSFTNGEAENAVILYEPKQRLLFAGDIVTHRIHLNMIDQRLDGWLGHLLELKKYDVYRLYPGRGEPGDESLINNCINYMETFRKSLITNDPRAIVDIMNYYFPGYLMQGNLRASVNKLLPK